MTATETTSAQGADLLPSQRAELLALVEEIEQARQVMDDDSNADMAVRCVLGAVRRKLLDILGGEEDEP